MDSTELQLRHENAILEAKELKTKNEIALKQTEALTSLAQGVNAIANFLTNGGLGEILSGYARSQSVKDILGGLAAHDGRGSLDARVLGQNAIEIVHAVEAVFEKYQEKLAAKARGEVRDSELHDNEKAFVEWAEKQQQLKDV